jgi:ubiquinone/menaquinone biosynthesis C-methylase UbiE
MQLKRPMIRTIIRQFGHPRGVPGHLVGWVMAHRPSNRHRNHWVVCLLEVLPTDRVLEVGFGPGLAIEELGHQIGPAGHVWGLDHSAVMLQQASRRNSAAIRSGRVTLTQASVEDLPTSMNGPFDLVLSVNSIGFWSSPIQQLEELRRRLVRGGRIAIVSQPRAGRTISAPEVATEIQGLLHSAGFTRLRTKTLFIDPPVVCVIGVNGDPDPIASRP